jgi:predicted amidohydrolase
MCTMVEHALVGYEPFFDLRLFVFPEFAHAVPIHETVAKLRDALAVQLPNEHTDRYSRLCAKYGCFIQTGTFIEVDPAWPECVFNTTALIGPTGVLAYYRKVNPWIPWEVHTSPHDLLACGYDREPFPVVETELGRLGVAICYDWLFPETIRQIAFNGAEVICRVSAYMDPWGTAGSTDWWTLFNRTRAAENSVYVVASNQGATLQHYPPFSWPGGSMVVDFDGRILAVAEAGPGERVVVAPIDLDSLRAERARRAGHDMRSHHRAELHPYASQPMFAPSGRQEITLASVRDRIADAKRRAEGRVNVQ